MGQDKISPGYARCPAARAAARTPSPGPQTTPAAMQERAVAQKHGATEQPICSPMDPQQPAALGGGERSAQPPLDAQVPEPLHQPIARLAGGSLDARTGFVAAELAVSVFHDQTTRHGGEI